MRVVLSKTWIGVCVYRFLLIGVAGALLSRVPKSLSTVGLLHILAGYGLIALGLSGWWFRGGSRRLIFQASLWFLDVILAGLLLVKFSHNGTFVPAFLPLLAYEAELYWPNRGITMGGLSAGLLLVSTWWLRLWSHRTPWHDSTLLFWSLFLIGFIVMPLRLAKAESVRSPSSNTTVNKADPPAPAESMLTPREREVFERIQSGASLRQISRELQVSYSTVKTHARHISEKLSSDA